MKKVRFETPIKDLFPRMDDSECHSPRPFIDKQVPSYVSQVPDLFQYQRLLSYSDDPVKRYECCDSSPYPSVLKTNLPDIGERGSKYMPSNDLELSMLDCHEPRRQQLYRTPTELQTYSASRHNVSTQSYVPTPRLRPCFEDKVITNDKSTKLPNILSPIENSPSNVLRKDNSFFLKRDNLDKFCVDLEPLQSQFNRLGLGKENESISRKIDNVIPETQKPNCQENVYLYPESLNTTEESDCRCHHCLKAIQINTPQISPLVKSVQNHCQVMGHVKSLCGVRQCSCMPVPVTCFGCDNHMQRSHKCCSVPSNSPPVPQNAVEKKNWSIEKFEQSKKECKELEKQTNLVKEKREPTVADLFKIIKLQNEQLQLLQEKVDKFISTTNQRTQNVQPVQNYMAEHVALQTIDTEHKISIGVMTSFEMVRTSTVINKEIVKQSCENAQIQCNRSQISIKEVISKSQPVSMNFLDGIMPVNRTNETDDTGRESTDEGAIKNTHQGENVMETLNELSLYNVQVDNATTPLISPEQSLYLDVRDYSESDSGSDTQSNVGWTYYNKVMNRVNGLLQDSDMPSSASALYRNTRQQCVQMQIDKTNVSVTKRVKFGDDPLGIHQPHIYSSATDTSIKMNQLAAKYLKCAPAPPRMIKPSTMPIDMSFATRNYMERHKITQGFCTESISPPLSEMPRFLDITALKQQPKFL
ncbi:uncharacterized protein LOC113232872 isoform X2 [Hyposmocoma kahamanoa]|uniref:uncharacterized protein LOC113232872 isoform X2 n=1 Tax=Hyposmocoma kahamanoa TaxID=1477025 RepID=UPI000E6D836B|nr:uncharacterized protein LOC113232872 isoform X2 [Hyposmocoma kahamanoa]